MDDDYLPTAGDEVGDVTSRFIRGTVLILDRDVQRIGDQRVASNGYDGSRHRYSTAPSTRESSAMRMTTP